MMAETAWKRKSLQEVRKAILKESKRKKDWKRWKNGTTMTIGNTNKESEPEPIVLSPEILMEAFVLLMEAIWNEDLKKLKKSEIREAQSIIFDAIIELSELRKNDSPFDYKSDPNLIRKYRIPRPPLIMDQWRFNTGQITYSNNTNTKGIG